MASNHRSSEFEAVSNMPRCSPFFIIVGLVLLISQVHAGDPRQRLDASGNDGFAPSYQIVTPMVGRITGTKLVGSRQRLG